MTVRVSLMLRIADTAPVEVDFVFFASAIPEDGLHGVAIPLNGRVLSSPR